MQELNRILLQLNKGVDCFNSPYTQEQALAVILLDNLIEVQMYKRIKNHLVWDETTWFSDRYYTEKTRVKVLSYYDNLLKFAKDNSLISITDLETLKYAHNIRNEVYHKGTLDKLRINIAITIYYNFIKKYFPTWGSPEMWICLGYGNSRDFESIDFGQKNDDSNKEKKSFKYDETLDYILRKTRGAFKQFGFLNC